MLDYRELPPLSVDSVEVSSESKQVCGGCSAELAYTYRVDIPSICGRCLGEQLFPAGTEVHRNTTDIMEFVRASPVGFQWDYLRQAHVPTHPWKRRRAGDPAPEASFRITDWKPDPLTPKKNPPGYHWDRSLNAYMPDPTDKFIPEPKGPYVPDALRNRRPTFGDPPGDVHDYIVQNYSPMDVRERYSEIKDELLYPPRPTIVITAEREPEPENNLTAPENPAILEDKNEPNPETEETDVVSVLSRSEAEAAYKQAAKALAEIERLEQKYAPDLPNGSVIAFRLTFPDSPAHYNYAAIKAAGQWFATGRIHASHPAGVGVDWSVLLECFEQFAATDFTLLREGGDQAELLSGTDQRTVTLNPDAPLTAFEPEDEHETPRRTSTITGHIEDDDEDDH